MTAREIKKHPEYPYVIWDLPAVKEGKLAVAATRGGPINIKYEVHGQGPRHIVVRRLLYLVCVQGEC
jgi:hypothetical protein